MRKIALLGLIVAFATTALAVPAKPGPTIITDADGTEHTVYLHGDEFFHYMTLADGRWVEMQNGRLAEVPALSQDEIMNRHNARRAKLAPQRVMTATNQARPLNIAPRGLIILANFSDVSFSAENTLAAFEAMFDSETYTYHGATGSARRYFEDQSFGQYRPDFDVVGPVTVSQPQKYYGANSRMGDDSHPDELIIEACQLANTEWNVDFTPYDNDHDGVIDFVYVIYAGQGEADGGPTYTIWPHTAYIYQSYGKTVYLDGLMLNTYACSNELHYVLGFGLTREGIGSFCHEFSHVLGLPDHYATNNSLVKQTGYWDLMCSGSYNNNSNTPAGYTAYERFYMGWGTPIILNEPVTIDSMQSLVSTGEMYIVTETGESNLKGNDPNPTKFYMLENRVRESWDMYVPGEGLLITYINYSYGRWTSNTVNNYEPRGYYIIEADGKAPQYPDLGYMGKATDAFPTEDVNSCLLFDNIPVSGIKRHDDNTIHFDFKGGSDHIGSIAKEKAEEWYGEDYTEVVAVFDAAGRKVHSEGNLNDLPQGMYIVSVSNGKKEKGVKIYIK